MFTRVVTKQKDELWLWKPENVVGRSEIQRMHREKSTIRFEEYLRKTERLI